MNQKRSKQSKLAKQTLKCQCCLKTIENDYQAVEITNKIARQFQKFTNLEVNRVTHVEFYLIVFFIYSLQLKIVLTKYVLLARKN